jgi:hypothetical protein
VKAPRLFFKKFKKIIFFNKLINTYIHKGGGEGKEVSDLFLPTGSENTFG